MRNLLVLLTVIVACALGYWAEPKLRPHISILPATAKPNVENSAKEASPSSQETSSAPQKATVSGKPSIEINGPLPDRITLNEEVKFKDQTIASGTDVILVRIESNNAIVRVPENDETFTVPIAQTDLEARLWQAQPAEDAPAPSTDAAPEGETEPAPVSEAGS